MNQNGSVGITLPPKWVRKCEIEVGDTLVFQEMGDGSLKLYKEPELDEGSSNMPGYAGLKEE
jgi:hypothetical protein